jgi:hypothetical protein
VKPNLSVRTFFLCQQCPLLVELIASLTTIFNLEDETIERINKCLDQSRRRWWTLAIAELQGGEAPAIIQLAHAA